jgi:PAS domain S-box-containing protein
MLCQKGLTVAFNLRALSTGRSRRPRTAWFAVQIAGLYVLVSAAWIYFSDWLVGSLIHDPDRLQRAQTIKGWGFVFVTGLLLGALIYHRSRALESLHQNLRSIYRASPLPIIALDREGTVLAWNPAAEEVFGWSEAEVLGRPDPTTRPRTLDPSRDQIAAGHSFSGLEVQQYRKDGTALDVDMAMAPLRDATGEVIGVVVISEDITHRKHAERLDRERQGVLESARTMDEALGVIGHELRTPLASLQLMAERLAENPEARETGDYARSIHAELVRMTEMANNMLEAARLSRGSPRWNFTTVNLGEIFSDVAEIFSALLDPGRVRLEIRVDPLDLSMIGDANAIRRLLINLLTNAQKHTPRGTIRAAARGFSSQGHRWVELRVEDTGVGIPPEIVKAMGKAFETSTGAVGGQYVSGAGLGLAICRGIVAAHAGRMHVTTAPGRGTSVCVTLRADLAEPISNASPAELTASMPG